MGYLKRMAILAVFSLAVVSGAAAAMGYSGQELAKDAKVTMSEARAIALKVVSGKITDEELEKEGGGSGLRYSFDIEYQGATHEVGIDARTGKLLENSTEGAHPD